MAHSSRTTEQFLLAAKQAEIQGLQHLAHTCQLVSGVSKLIHQLQRERGLSNIYLASRGQHYHRERLQQAATTFSAERELRELLEQNYLTGSVEVSPRLLSSAAFVLQGLDELADLRQRVENVDIEAASVTTGLSRLISGLLSVVFEAADGAGDPLVSKALVAQLNFMQGKEFSGQERAWAGNGFAGGFFDQALKEKLENLQHAQKRSFEIFQQFAEAEQLQVWQDINASKNSQELYRLRGLIRDIGKPEQIPSQLSEIWYEVATQRIDDMQTLEAAMTRNLLDLCSQEINKARASLREQQGRLDALSVAPVNQSPMSMLINLDSPINPWFAASGKDSDETAGFESNTAIGKSVYDLLREQAEHLRRISDDLNEARRVLEERKLVEQAKGLLIKNLGLSEEVAYRKMQKKAMESNLNMTEVSHLLIKAVGKHS